MHIKLMTLSTNSVILSKIYITCWSFIDKIKYLFNLKVNTFCLYVKKNKKKTELIANESY